MTDRPTPEQPVASPVDLDVLIATLLTTQPDRVAAWLRDEPGSWGALAGQAVLATHWALGRRLAEAERRVVWQCLWDQLTALRRSGEG